MYTRLRIDKKITLITIFQSCILLMSSFVIAVLYWLIDTVSTVNKPSNNTAINQVIPCSHLRIE